MLSGLLGTVFMALTFTIVSFTCVAPFLGGFAGIASSGQFRWYEMLLGAFAFSAAFAAPFFLLALFPSRLWVEQLWIQQETHPGQSLAAWAVDLPTRLSTEPLQ